jgi:hypothetical protein
MRLIEKYQPNFKLKRFSLEEGKEKIIKKFKEILDRNQMGYNENLLGNIFIPQGTQYII